MTLSGSENLSGSEKQWRTDAIQATYATGETFAWMIDGRIELELDEQTPVAAWTLFIPARSRMQRPLLGTFHQWDRDTGYRFQVWKLSEPNTVGVITGTLLNKLAYGRYIDYTEYPGNTKDPNNVSPVLKDLVDAAAERWRVHAEEQARKRQADPWFNLHDYLEQTAMDEDADGVRKIIAGLSRTELEDLFVREALYHAKVAMDTVEEDDENRDPDR